MKNRKLIGSIIISLFMVSGAVSAAESETKAIIIKDSNIEKVNFYEIDVPQSLIEKIKQTESKELQSITGGLGQEAYILRIAGGIIAGVLILGAS